MLMMDRMETKQQRKRGKSKNQSDGSFDRHAQSYKNGMESNSNYLSNDSFASPHGHHNHSHSPSRTSRGRQYRNNQMGYNHSNEQNAMHSMAQNGHHSSPHPNNRYHRDNSFHARYFRGRSDAHLSNARFQGPHHGNHQSHGNHPYGKGGFPGHGGKARNQYQFHHPHNVFNSGNSHGHHHSNGNGNNNTHHSHGQKGNTSQHGPNSHNAHSHPNAHPNNAHAHPNRRHRKHFDDLNMLTAHSLNATHPPPHPPNHPHHHHHHNAPLHHKHNAHSHPSHNAHTAHPSHPSHNAHPQHPSHPNHHNARATHHPPTPQHTPSSGHTSTNGPAPSLTTNCTNPHDAHASHSSHPSHAHHSNTIASALSNHAHAHNHSHNQLMSPQTLQMTPMLGEQEDEEDSPADPFYEDDRIRCNDGSHKYHRFEDQDYELNPEEMTKICQILGQKHEIHDKVKSRARNRDFSTILARFLLKLLERLENCDVDGFGVGSILLGGGAAAYVLDAHSKPPNSPTCSNNSSHHNGQYEESKAMEDHTEISRDSPNDSSSLPPKFAPLHYNDVDIMLEIDFQEWDELVAQWTQTQISQISQLSTNATNELCSCSLHSNDHGNGSDESKGPDVIHVDDSTVDRNETIPTDEVKEADDDSDDQDRHEPAPSNTAPSETNPSETVDEDLEKTDAAATDAAVKDIAVSDDEENEQKDLESSPSKQSQALSPSRSISESEEAKTPSPRSTDSAVIELPFRSEKEHHVAVYAAIRSAFLECLREFAPRDMQQMDIEDICNAYVDAQKRFLCDEESNNGGASDCWAIYSGNHDRGHYLDIVFIHKMRRRYTFSTDSFRIKLTKAALQYISDSVSKHHRQYHRQQFHKRQPSYSWPNEETLQTKRQELDVERIRKKQQKEASPLSRAKTDPSIEDGDKTKDMDSSQQNGQMASNQLNESQPDNGNNANHNENGTNNKGNNTNNGISSIAPRNVSAAPFIPRQRPSTSGASGGGGISHRSIRFATPRIRHQLGPVGPPNRTFFPGYPAPNEKVPKMVNWHKLATQLRDEGIAFNAYALCGDFQKARDNLTNRNIGKVHNPETIHGGGFFKYCDLVSKQWQRSEKLEKLLFLRLSWDIEDKFESTTPRQHQQSTVSYDPTSNPNGINGGDEFPYNYMTDLRDIDRSLATYVRRHYKNRPRQVESFLNCLENVLKDLGGDEPQVVVLSEHVDKLKRKVQRHLHEERQFQERRKAEQQAQSQQLLNGLAGVNGNGIVNGMNGVNGNGATNPIPNMTNTTAATANNGVNHRASSPLITQHTVNGVNLMALNGVSQNGQHSPPFTPNLNAISGVNGQHSQGTAHTLAIGGHPLPISHAHLNGVTGVNGHASPHTHAIPNGTFPPLPSNAPVMQPTGGLLQSHFANLQHHNHLRKNFMLPYAMPYPQPQPAPQPPSHSMNLTATNGANRQLLIPSFLHTPVHTPNGPAHNLRTSSPPQPSALPIPPPPAPIGNQLGGIPPLNKSVSSPGMGNFAAAMLRNGMQPYYHISPETASHLRFNPLGVNPLGVNPNGNDMDDNDADDEHEVEEDDEKEESADEADMIMSNEDADDMTGFVTVNSLNQDEDGNARNALNNHNEMQIAAHSRNDGLNATESNEEMARMAPNDVNTQNMNTQNVLNQNGPNEIQMNVNTLHIISNDKRVPCTPSPQPSKSGSTTPIPRASRSTTPLDPIVNQLGAQIAERMELSPSITAHASDKNNKDTSPSTDREDSSGTAVSGVGNEDTIEGVRGSTANAMTSTNSSPLNEQEGANTNPIITSQTQQNNQQQNVMNGVNAQQINPSALSLNHVLPFQLSLPSGPLAAALNANANVNATAGGALKVVRPPFTAAQVHQAPAIVRFPHGQPVSMQYFHVVMPVPVACNNNHFVFVNNVNNNLNMNGMNQMLATQVMPQNTNNNLNDNDDGKHDLGATGQSSESISPAPPQTIYSIYHQPVAAGDLERARANMLTTLKNKVANTLATGPADRQRTSSPPARPHGHPQMQPVPPMYHANATNLQRVAAARNAMHNNLYNRMGVGALGAAAGAGSVGVSGANGGNQGGFMGNMSAMNPMTSLSSNLGQSLSPNVNGLNGPFSPPKMNNSERFRRPGFSPQHPSPNKTTDSFNVQDINGYYDLFPNGHNGHHGLDISGCNAPSGGGNNGGGGNNRHGNGKRNGLDKEHGNGHNGHHHNGNHHNKSSRRQFFGNHSGNHSNHNGNNGNHNGNNHGNHGNHNNNHSNHSNHGNHGNHHGNGNNNNNNSNSNNNNNNNNSNMDQHSHSSTSSSHHHSHNNHNHGGNGNGSHSGHNGQNNHSSNHGHSHNHGGHGHGRYRDRQRNKNGNGSNGHNHYRDYKRGGRQRQYR